jgi:hypothetical protein
LQTGGEVGRFADDRLFLCGAFADQIADDHQPGGDPDARLQFDGPHIEAADRVDDTQPRPDRPLGIVLMRSWVAEIDQHAVAHVLGDETVESGYHLGNRTVIRADDLAQIFGIEARGEFGRADQIAEHHRELSAFSIAGSRRGDGGCRRAGVPRVHRCRRAGTQGSDGVEELTAMAD